MAYLENIARGQVLKLADEVVTTPGKTICKTLVKNDAVAVLLFAFSRGKELRTHTSEGDAMVLVLEGCGEFTLDGTKHVCHAGESIVIPADLPHSVYAGEDFKMMLTIVFPPEKK